MPPITFGAKIADKPEGMYVPIQFTELTQLDVETRDGRTILSEGFGMDEAPRTIYFQKAQAPGHDGSVAVGRLDSLSVDGSLVTATGWLADTPEGREAAFLVRTGVLRGNSVDLGVREKDVIVDVQYEEEDDFPTITAKFRNASVTATTLVGKPAFHNAAAVIPDDYEVAPISMGDRERDAIVAAAAARPTMAYAFSDTAEKTVARAASFYEPNLSEPTPLTVEDTGEVFGHVAAWGTRHLSSGVAPPRSRSGYAYFATGGIVTDDGMIPVGRLAIDGDHAAHTLGWHAAVDHYANTCAAWADVAVGEDTHGIWVHGRVRPGTEERLIHAARNSALSGDWRSIGGGMELIAALSVNTPGFPIPRAHAYAVGDHQRSLVAAGLVRPRGPQRLSDVALSALESLGQRLAADEQAERDREAEVLAIELDLEEG